MMKVVRNIVVGCAFVPVLIADIHASEAGWPSGAVLLGAALVVISVAAVRS